MIVSLASLVSKLEVLLRDTEGRSWEETDLQTFIGIAVTQWTTDVPILTSAEYTATADNVYTLPENAVQVYSAYGRFEGSVNEEWLVATPVRPGLSLSEMEPWRFVVGFPDEEGFLLLRRCLTGNFLLYYGGYHPPLSSSAGLNLRGKWWGEQAVLFYAAYLAHLPHAASRARLEQFARRQDLNVGNPLEEQSTLYLRRYYDLIERYGQPVTFDFMR